MNNARIILSQDISILRAHVECQRLIPPGATSLLLDWPQPPDALDVPILPETAKAICRALLKQGTMAFRWDKETPAPPGRHRLLPAPEPSLLRRFSEGLLASNPAASSDILITDDIETAPSLFNWGGWTWGAQAALVFDPAVTKAEAVATQLWHGLDWRQTPWLPGVHLLFGAGHDGACAIASAPTPRGIDRFTGDLAGPEDD